LHEFGRHGCEFFEKLAKTDDIEVFKHASIHYLIEYKWEKVGWFVRNAQFLPHLGMVLTHLFWHVNLRPYRSENEFGNFILTIMLILFVIYFLLIEIRQIWYDYRDYFYNFGDNVTQVFPLATILASCFSAFVMTEQ
jgi:hypothetical protein